EGLRRRGRHHPDRRHSDRGSDRGRRRSPPGCTALRPRAVRAQVPFPRRGARRRRRDRTVPGRGGEPAGPRGRRAGATEHPGHERNGGPPDRAEGTLLTRYSTKTDSPKRRDPRALPTPGAARPFPGALTPLSVALIQEKGFPGVYISGAVIANELGLPDVGLTTLSEVAARGGQIARATDLPCLIDADTGFGEPMNVARTVQELEEAGLAGC